MSIILKGIDLPKKNLRVICLFPHGAEELVVLDADSGSTAGRPIEATQIPTPHGRLIDGDEFKSWVDDWYDCTDIGNIVESWIDERPTILEAEE